VVIEGSVCCACQNDLGESAIWSAASGVVRWIDGVAPTLHQWNPQDGGHRATPLQLPAPVGMIAGTTDARTIAVAHRDGLALLDLESGVETPVAAPERARAGIAYNDAKVDPMGRLWLGSFDTGGVEPRGCLWVLENGRRPRLAETGMAVVNGPAFSPDGATIYVSDSIARRILAFDVVDGALRHCRTFATMSAEEGLPDGLTVDAEGCLWCAHWEGSRVTRFAPTGERLSVIPIPAPLVTSVAFGRAELDTLFVTTARQGLSADDLARAPRSGDLFSIVPGVKGLQANLLPLPFTCGE
jgi:sugar lactone lactonase YvrE